MIFTQTIRTELVIFSSQLFRNVLRIPVLQLMLMATDGESVLPTSAAGESTKSPVQQKSAKRRRMADTLEDGIASNAVLGEMIVKAFDHNPDLHPDGAGKVHIGNGVYISSSVFYDKIAKVKVSPSITLRDATGLVYSTSELAERSLEGGTPVKANAQNEKVKKIKMTPAKRESLLGIFRAKTQQVDGNSDKMYLDLAVDKKGRSVLRDKMKEASKKANANAHRAADV